jgi:hypothetical protein
MGCPIQVGRRLGQERQKIGFSGVYFLTYAGDAILGSQASEAR